MSITVNENLIYDLQAQLRTANQTIERLRNEFSLVAEMGNKHRDQRDELRATVAQQAATIGELAEALNVIAAWKFPPTGRKWDDGSDMSYGAAYGSNGQRDYMLKIAEEALAKLPKEKTT